MAKTTILDTRPATRMFGRLSLYLLKFWQHAPEIHQFFAKNHATRILGIVLSAVIAGGLATGIAALMAYFSSVVLPVGIPLLSFAYLQLPMMAGIAVGAGVGIVGAIQAAWQHFMPSYTRKGDSWHKDSPKKASFFASWLGYMPALVMFGLGVAMFAPVLLGVLIDELFNFLSCGLWGKHVGKSEQSEEVKDADGGYVMVNNNENNTNTNTNTNTSTSGNTNQPPQSDLEPNDSYGNLVPSSNKGDNASMNNLLDDGARSPSPTSSNS